MSGDPDDFLAFARISDTHRVVHLGRPTDMLGQVLCGYIVRHLDEYITGLAGPGERWRFGGRVCPACTRVAAGGPVSPRPHRPRPVSPARHAGI